MLRASLSAAADGLQRLLPTLQPLDRTASDRRLAEACLAGQQRAWSALIEKYSNLIYSVPIRYGIPPQDAADIFQAVCVELFHELPRLRNVENLRPWLMTVAAHQAYHWKRRERQRGQGDAEALREASPEVVLPPALSHELEREQLVREAIARLPRRCRELVRLLFYEQPSWPYERVARHLGLATGSIGFVRARCLKRLERALEELGF